MKYKMAHCMPRTVAWMLLCLGACLSLMLGACSAQGGDDSIAAEFGDEKLSEAQVNDYTQQFRLQNGYEGDVAWSLFLGEQGYTAKTWREHAIRALAERALVRREASRMGIAPDEEAVAQGVAAFAALHDVDPEDADAWAEALERQGLTEEALRERYELASLEQQLIQGSDPAGETNADAQNSQAFIDANLLDVVTRRYSYVEYPIALHADAQEALDELAALDEDERIDRAQEIAQEGADQEVRFVDAGWDLGTGFAGLLNGDFLLEADAGFVYPSLVQVGSVTRIYIVTDRYAFDSSSKAAELDETLRKAILAEATASDWAVRADAYLAELVEEANVQVHPMPEGLPYDVDPYTDYSDAARAYGS